MNAPFENKDIAVELLTQNGFPAVAKMISQFDRPADMDKALGLPGNLHNWFSLRTMPSKAAERLAEIWIQNNLDREPDVEAHPQPEQAEPSFEAEEVVTLLVTCIPSKKASVLKVLGMLKCDVEVLSDD